MLLTNTNTNFKKKISFISRRNCCIILYIVTQWKSTHLVEIVKHFLSKNVHNIVTIKLCIILNFISLFCVTGQNENCRTSLVAADDSLEWPVASTGTCGIVNNIHTAPSRPPGHHYQLRSASSLTLHGGGILAPMDLPVPSNHLICSVLPKIWVYKFKQRPVFWCVIPCRRRHSLWL